MAQLGTLRSQDRNDGFNLAAAAIADAPAACPSGADKIEFPSSIGSPDAPPRPDFISDRGEVRMEILAAFDDFRALGIPVLRDAMREFAVRYNARQLGMADQVYASVRRISPSSIARWRKASAGDLGGHYGNRAGSGLIDNDSNLRDFIAAKLTFRPHHTTAREIHDELVHCGRFTAPFPAIATVKRFVRRFRSDPQFLAIANPDGWRGRWQSRIGDADQHIVRPNQEWQIDGTPGPIFVLMPDGGQRACYLIKLVDIYTRRTTTLVCDSENSDAVAQLIRRAILAWGVPDMIHGDNGRAFVSNHVQRILADLGIAYKASPPFRPETKPFIESLIGVIQHELLVRLPGFKGFNVADAQAIRNQKSFAERFGAPAKMLYRVALTAAELQARIDQWDGKIYGERAHSQTSRIPNAAAEGFEIRRIDDRALDPLLGRGEVRMIGPGGIRVAGALYVPTLDGAPEYGLHIGERARVLTTGDYGRVIVWLERPRQFVCIAEAPERVGQSLSEIAAIVKAAQRKVVRVFAEDGRRAQRAVKPQLISQITMDRQAAAAPNRLNLVLDAAVEHVTASTTAAREAADALDAVSLPRAPHDEAIIAEGMRLIATSQARFRWPETDEVDCLYIAIRDDLPRPDWSAEYLAVIGRDEIEWCAGYEGTLEWESYRKLERIAAAS